MFTGNPGISLNRYAKWHEVLRLLGIQVETVVLPTTVTCPHCTRSTLHIYKDITGAGEWHYCSSCNFAGDTIELAALVWKQDIKTTILKLNAEGVTFPDDSLDEDIITRYILGYVEYRKELLKLWELSRERFPLQDTDALRELHDKFTAGHAATSITWTKRGKHFLGGCHVDDAERAFRQIKVRNNGPDMKPWRLNSSRQIFKGRGWGDILAIPFFELPGKIRGFLFIGRDADPSSDFVYRRATNQAGKRPKLGSNSPIYDPGLSMYETVFQYHDRYKRTTFVFTDPVLALRIQLRHLKQNRKPLPIVGSYVGDHLLNRQMWDTMFSREFIFWGPHVTAELIHQARAAGGKIAVSKTLRIMPDKMTYKSPTQWLDIIQRQAAPWNKVLEQEIRESSLPAAESLLLALKMSKQELREFATSCAPDVREKLDDLFEIANCDVQSTAIDGKTVLQSEGKWTLEDGTIICDSPLRIEQIIYQPDKKKTCYKGYVTRQGAQVGFSEDAGVLENTLMRWMRELLISSGLGRPLIMNGWKRHIMTLAQLFHEPECVVGVDSFGWCPTRQSFMFPRFTLLRDGSVKEELAPRVLDDVTPARTLKTPRRLAAASAKTLSEMGDTLDSFWATTACVAANIVAPVFGLPSTGIALHGRNAQMVGKATAKIHGCVDVKIEYTTIAAGVRKLESASNAHGWPFVLQQPGPAVASKQKILRAWLADHDPKNCVIAANWYQAQALMINGGWNIIDCQSPGTAFRSISDAGQSVLPAFLQYICQQRLAIPREEGLVRGVLTLLDDWFTQLGGRSLSRVRDIMHVGEVHAPQSNVKEYFLNIVYQLLSDGLLRFVTHGVNEAGVETHIVHHGSMIYVPQRATLARLARRGAPDLDLVALTQELGSQDVGYQAYWTIPEKEWADEMRRRKPGAQTKVC